MHPFAQVAKMMIGMFIDIYVARTCEAVFYNLTLHCSLHYALPGPLDWWNHLLYSKLVNLAMMRHTVKPT